LHTLCPRFGSKSVQFQMHTAHGNGSNSRPGASSVTPTLFLIESATIATSEALTSRSVESPLQSAISDTPTFLLQYTDVTTELSNRGPHRTRGTDYLLRFEADRFSYQRVAREAATITSLKDRSAATTSLSLYCRRRCPIDWAPLNTRNRLEAIVGQPLHQC
jgi:hypothetical protein